MFATRERILMIQKILMEETCAENPITTDELIQCLETEGIKAERKSVYKDLNVLKKFHHISFNPKGRKGGSGWYFEK